MIREKNNFIIILKHLILRRERESERERERETATLVIEK